MLSENSERYTKIASTFSLKVKENMICDLENFNQYIIHTFKDNIKLKYK